MYYSKGQKLLAAIILAVLFTCALLSEGIVWFTDNYWQPISAEFGGGQFSNEDIIATADGRVGFAASFNLPDGRFSDSCLCAGSPDVLGELVALLLLPSPAMNSGETLTDNMRGNMEALAEVAEQIGESSVSDQRDELDDE